MSKTDHSRPARKAYAPTTTFGKRQPRPALRKQSTRKGAVLAATREAGVR